MPDKALRFLMWVGAPICLLHEGAHWLAARALGYSATLHLNKATWERPKRVLHDVLVLLAPLVPGVILYAIDIFMWSITRDSMWLSLAMVHLPFWLISCASDIYACEFVLQRGRFPRFSEMPAWLRWILRFNMA